MGELLNELGSLFHSICTEYELSVDPFISSLSHLSGYEPAYKELLSKALETLQEKKQLASKQSKPSTQSETIECNIYKYIYIYDAFHVCVEESSEAFESHCLAIDESYRVAASQLADCQSRMKSLETENNGLTTQLLSLQESIKTNQVIESDYKNRVFQLECSLRDAQSNLESKNGVTSASEAENAYLKEKLKGLKEELSSLSHELSTLKSNSHLQQVGHLHVAPRKIPHWRLCRFNIVQVCKRWDSLEPN